MTVANRPDVLDTIYAIPVSDQCLIYAPLHHFAALTDVLAAHRIRDGLVLSSDGGTEGLREIVEILRVPAEPVPLPPEGDFEPAFLGLIPTRGCNLACEYCGFLDAEEPEEVMDLGLARDAIDWYLDLVRRNGLSTAEVHFFGGEPFCAGDVIEFAFHYARLKAAEFGCTVRFEVATNGTFDEDRCRWAGDSLDHIVLSLDGPADIQDWHRHRKDGRGSYEAVVRSARILSEGANALSFRVCVTAETVGRMPEVATWLCQDFRPDSVSFEPVQPSAPSRAAGLAPPDPWVFARRFADAAWILEAYGIVPVYAAADIAARRVSFCPVGQDVPIVSPEGLGTIADGYFGDYHYRHPEYATYRRSVGERCPGLQGGLRRSEVEQHLQPLTIALLAGSVVPTLFADPVSQTLLHDWQRSMLLVDDPETGNLRLTGNGSWFVGNMISDLVGIASSGTLR